MRDDVRRRLIEVAKKSKTITYGQLMKEFGIPRGHPKPGIGIGYVVGDISVYEHSKGRPFLSAIVVRANSETEVCPDGHPGGGFFGLDGIPNRLFRDNAAFDRPLSIEEQKYLRKQQEELWSFWSAHER